MDRRIGCLMDLEMAKVKRNRSPNYPVVSLKSALDYLEKLYKYANGQHAVPLMAVCEDAWEMKRTSAYGKQVVAALKAFGLVADEGTGDTRKIGVTDDGAKIRGQHSDRPALLRKAALSPKIHSELWSEFSKDGKLPPASSMRQYLTLDRDGNRFNESSVDDFIAEFQETVEFANPGKLSGIEGDTSNNETGPDDSDDSEIKVGSIVQWRSESGELRFEKPYSITRIDERDGQRFAYFEAKGGHAPMSVLVLAEEAKDEINLITPEEPSGAAFKSPDGLMEADTLKLGDIRVVVDRPAKMSPAAFEELQMMFNLLSGNAKRAISQDADQSPADSEN